MDYLWLSLAEEIGGVLVGDVDEFLERLERLLEFLGEFDVLLVLPGIAQSGEAGLKRDHLILKVGVEPLEILGEPPHLFGIHDCLRHNRSFSFSRTNRKGLGR